MNTIKILFLRKKDVGGVQTYQNNMLHIFNYSPNFELFIIKEELKAKNKISNYIYQSVQTIPVLDIFLNYTFLIIQVRRQVRRFKNKYMYLFIPHYFKYGLFAILISLLFKIPFIVPLHGWTENELKLEGTSKIKLFIQLKYESLICKKAKYILSPEDLINKYVKIINDENKFLSVDSPIDTDKFKPAFRSENQKNKLKIRNKKIILTSAILEGVKGEGAKRLLKAFTLIKEKYSNVVLWIAGDGHQREELEDIAKKMKEKDDVIFLGYCNNMPELINLCDVFVHIFSFGGGIGTATKEAMACEKPCVVSKTSGTEVLNNGKEVLLVNLNPKDIADKIILLLKNEECARRLGINAKKRIETDYSITKTEEKLVKKLKGMD